MIKLEDDIEALVIHQLHNFFLKVDDGSIKSSIPLALNDMDETFRGSPNKRFWNGEETLFSPYMSVQWMIFLYRLSHRLYENGGGTAADQVYYLNKIMHGIDWFYAVRLPVHFMCEHPLGSVLGRASYGDHLFVYQGTTVGGNRKRGQLCYPVIGDNVILFANATVLGDTRIGDNTVISADTYIINENIPGNCIVFGKSPDLTVVTKTENEIKEYTKHIWGW